MLSDVGILFALFLSMDDNTLMRGMREYRCPTTLTARIAAAVALCSTTALGGIDLGTFNASGTSPSDGKPVAVSAHFVESAPGQLQVTLVNTYSGATFGIGDAVYGLYFSGASGLSLSSVQAPTGSKIWDGSVQPATYTIVGTTPVAINWQASSLPGTPAGTERGVSALGMGNQSDGLLSAGFAGDFSTDGLKNSNHNPFVQNSAVFAFTYTGTLSAIGNVEFLFGTSLEQTDTLAGIVAAVPEANFSLGSIVLVLPLGMLALFRTACVSNLRRSAAL